MVWKYIACINNYYDSVLTVMVLFEAWRHQFPFLVIAWKRDQYILQNIFFGLPLKKRSHRFSKWVSKWFHEFSCLGELYFTVWDHFHVSSWFLEPYSVRCYIIGADCSHWISTFMFLMRWLSKPNTFPVTVFLSRRRCFLSIEPLLKLCFGHHTKLNTYMMSSKNGSYIWDTLRNLPWPCLDLTPFIVN